MKTTTLAQASYVIVFVAGQNMEKKYHKHLWCSHRMECKCDHLGMVERSKIRFLIYLARFLNASGRIYY
jgi:hypothetical protein